VALAPGVALGGTEGRGVARGRGVRAGVGALGAALAAGEAVPATSVGVELGAPAIALGSLVCGAPSVCDGAKVSESTVWTGFGSQSDTTTTSAKTTSTAAVSRHSRMRGSRGRSQAGR
jgi:hypothetical protein